LSQAGDIRVVPATVERWPDVQSLFEGMPCWCQYWRLSSSEYGRPSSDTLDQWVAARRNGLRRQLKRPTPPGVLAYLGEQVVGWCGIGPRPDMERLVRSRTIPAIDDRPVWTIVCFLVRPGFRRRGVAWALLRGAIEIARSHGAPGLEAYPVDPAGKRIDTAFAYVGTAAMFEREGFRRVAETTARSSGLPRWVMRLDFPAGG
jgi:GNAT superfamily N-acetyltransferase